VWNNSNYSAYTLVSKPAFLGSNPDAICERCYSLLTVNEPDGVLLSRPGASAIVRLDAYPGAVFHAVLESASPVASTSLESPVKFFLARFRILDKDPRLLPDLSAAVEVEPAK